MRRLLIVFLTTGLMAACTPRGTVIIDPAAASVGKVETLYIATTRGPDPETGEPFAFERSKETRYVRLGVAIPPDREPGKIDWPRPHAKPDPARDFLTTERDILPRPDAFRTQLAAEFRRRPAGKRDAIVFIHGFNMTFAEGAYRLAQLGHDLKLDSVLVHYSWPSRGHPLGYAYDRDSVLFARDGLQDVLEQVSAAGADHITIAAHSLGSLLTVETLRQMAPTRSSSGVWKKISGVVLFSPDVDVDLFHEEARAIGHLPQPFVIFTSKRDKALALSARLTGEKERLGNIDSADEVADLSVTVMDTTAFSTGVGHFDAADSATLLSILGKIATAGGVLEGDGRMGLLAGTVVTVRNATQIIMAPVAAMSGMSN